MSTRAKGNLLLEMLDNPERPDKSTFLQPLQPKSKPCPSEEHLQEAKDSDNADESTYQDEEPETGKFETLMAGKTPPKEFTGLLQQQSILIEQQQKREAAVEDPTDPDGQPRKERTEPGTPHHDAPHESQQEPDGDQRRPSAGAAGATTTSPPPKIQRGDSDTDEQHAVNDLKEQVKLLHSMLLELRSSGTTASRTNGMSPVHTVRSEMVTGGGPILPTATHLPEPQPRQRYQCNKDKARERPEPSRQWELEEQQQETTAASPTKILADMKKCGTIDHFTGSGTENFSSWLDRFETALDSQPSAITKGESDVAEDIDEGTSRPGSAGLHQQECRRPHQPPAKTNG
ncbi:MAG: hypothetical protein JWR85_3541 [Marmoricola sp.]|nr:hypothetical protein [Marmoricola sp.]